MMMTNIVVVAVKRVATRKPERIKIKNFSCSIEKCISSSGDELEILDTLRQI